MNYDSHIRNRVAKETQNVHIDMVQPQIDLSNIQFVSNNVSLISINIFMTPSVPSMPYKKGNQLLYLPTKHEEHVEHKK
jgi:hypothetical protein